LVGAVTGETESSGLFAIVKGGTESFVQFAAGKDGTGTPVLEVGWGGKAMLWVAEKGREVVEAGSFLVQGSLDSLLHGLTFFRYISLTFLS